MRWDTTDTHTHAYERACTQDGLEEIRRTRSHRQLRRRCHRGRRRIYIFKAFMISAPSFTISLVPPTIQAEQHGLTGGCRRRMGREEMLKKGIPKRKHDGGLYCSDDTSRGSKQRETIQFRLSRRLVWKRPLGGASC